jgi:hypothetical protein
MPLDVAILHRGRVLYIDLHHQMCVRQTFFFFLSLSIEPCATLMAHSAVINIGPTLFHATSSLALDLLARHLLALQILMHLVVCLFWRILMLLCRLASRSLLVYRRVSWIRFL